MLMEILLATLLALASAIPAVAIADTVPAGCPTSCGDVTIMYPFGVGKGCFREGFEITCQTSNKTTSKVPFLARPPVQVLNLSLDIAEARVNLPIAWECYNTSDLVEAYNEADVQFDASVYRISDTHNELKVIGCNTEAYIRSQPDSHGPYNYDYYTGCTSYCKDTESTIDGSCSGLGCCQVTIRANLSDYGFHFRSYTHVGFLNFSRCSYAFLVDKDSYRFAKSDLTMDTNTSMPVRLDWALREHNNCAEALAGQAYGCRSGNSECYDSSNGQGYLCKCTKGYQGNPYRPNGCVDINECKLPDLDLCKYGICRNKPGSHDCTFDIPPWMWGIMAGCAVIVALETIFCGCYRFQKIQSSKIKKRLTIFVEKSRNDNGLINYREEELEKITQKNNEIGRGAFGIVYRGNLPEGEVAIKKSIKFNEDQEKEFINEMITVSQITHENVVRLLDCCLVGVLPSLVYEYIPNGNLFSFLQKKLSEFNLKTRLRIAADSAAGLACLHSNEIVHGDVKSSNILLDNNFRAKISDFGTSKFLQKGKAIDVAFVTGTSGYKDPVYIETGKLIKESDVYSFGVVILELITGKKAKDDEDETNGTLVGQYKSAVVDKNLEELLDSNIENKELLLKVAELAGECLERDQKKRPKMDEVAERLQGFWAELQALGEEPYAEKIQFPSPQQPASEKRPMLSTSFLKHS